MKFDSNSCYLSVSQVAAILCCTPVTVRRMIKSGKLPAVEIGKRTKRISRDYIQAMIQTSLGDLENGNRSEDHINEKEPEN